MNSTEKDLSKLISEIKNQNKIILLNDAFQTKLFREIAGEDDDKREQQLDDIKDVLVEIRDSIAGSNIAPKATTLSQDLKSAESQVDKDQPERKEEFSELTGKEFAKLIIASFKKDLSPVSKAVFKTSEGARQLINTPREALSTFKEKSVESISSVKTFIEKSVESVKDVLKTEKDYFPIREKQPTEKSTKTDVNSSLQSVDNTNENITIPKAEAPEKFINPEADNIVTNDEIIADNSKKQTESLEGLETNQEATNKLLADIKDTLSLQAAAAISQSSRPTSSPYAPISSREENSIAIPDINLPEQTKKTTPKSKPVPAKTGGLKSVGKAAASIGSKALSAAKFLGPIGAAAGAAFSGVSGYQNTAQNFDLKEGEEATTGQKVSSTLGGIASGLTFGLVDEKSASQKIQNVGEKVGSFFGFGSDKKKDSNITDEFNGITPEDLPADTGPMKPLKKQPKIEDLGDGRIKKTNPDGSYSISGASGVEKYDAKGNLQSKAMPSIGGYKREESVDGSVKESLNFAPASMNVSKTKDKLGQVTETSADVDFGLMKASTVEAGGKKQLASEIRTGTAENIVLKEEISSQKPSTQPVVMSNVSNTSTNNYIPMKASPHPASRGSALDNYLNKVATF